MEPFQDDAGAATPGPREAATVSELIDTTEMYLRTIFELEEEGVVPLRARIAERLGQSGPTVSQTVARMARDGLLTVEGDRHLQLTDDGRMLATRVMRKHRLAECLLVDVIGLQWEQVHAEACRWEHVMSDEVERRLVQLLGHPTESPYGNPIPGLEALGETGEVDEFREGLLGLDKVATDEGASVVVRRIGEPAQGDQKVIHALDRAGVRPGQVVTATASHGGVLVGRGGETAELDLATASHVFVKVLGGRPA
jgi:DtxR family Mn-dependent transcriptional regulator